MTLLIILRDIVSFISKRTLKTAYQREMKKFNFNRREKNLFFLKRTEKKFIQRTVPVHDAGVRGQKVKQGRAQGGCLGTGSR